MRVSINGYIIPNDYKEVYDWFGIEAFCPDDLKAAKLAAGVEPLSVIIGTCYGGSIFAGSEIGAEIAAHEPGATIDILGLAASAASVIAMYAKCRMAPTAMMMVHNVSSVAEGDYHAMAKESDTLKRANEAMAAAYVMKSGMSYEEALKLMDKESWLTAQQALEIGLADEILFAEKDPSALVAGPGLLPRSVVEKTREMLREGRAKGQGQKEAFFETAYSKLNQIEKKLGGKKR